MQTVELDLNNYPALLNVAMQFQQIAEEVSRLDCGDVLENFDRGGKTHDEVALYVVDYVKEKKV